MKLVDLESEGLQPWPPFPQFDLEEDYRDDDDDDDYGHIWLIMLMMMMTPIRKMLDPEDLWQPCRLWEGTDHSLQSVLSIWSSSSSCWWWLHVLRDEIWHFTSFRFKLSDDEHWFLWVLLMQGHWSPSNILHKSDFSLHPPWQIKHNLQIWYFEGKGWDWDHF